MERIVGVLSDTHGLLRPAVEQRLRQCQLIVHAGDIGNKDVLDRLQSMGNLVAVKGNIDRDTWAERLPEWECIDFQGKNILVIHDIARLGLDPKAANVDVVVYGHSHRSAIYRKEGVLYVNPGSAGPGRFVFPTTIAYLRLIDQQIIPEIISIQETRTGKGR